MEGGSLGIGGDVLKMSTKKPVRVGVSFMEWMKSRFVFVGGMLFMFGLLCYSSLSFDQMIPSFFGLTGFIVLFMQNLSGLPHTKKFWINSFPEFQAGQSLLLLAGILCFIINLFFSLRCSDENCYTMLAQTISFLTSGSIFVLFSC